MRAGSGFEPTWAWLQAFWEGKIKEGFPRLHHETEAWWCLLVRGGPSESFWKSWKVLTMPLNLSLLGLRETLWGFSSSLRLSQATPGQSGLLTHEGRVSRLPTLLSPEAPLQWLMWERREMQVLWILLPLWGLVRRHECKKGGGEVCQGAPVAPQQ